MPDLLGAKLRLALVHARAASASGSRRGRGRPGPGAGPRSRTARAGRAPDRYARGFASQLSWCALSREDYGFFLARRLSSGRPGAGDRGGVDCGGSAAQLIIVRTRAPRRSGSRPSCRCRCASPPRFLHRHGVRGPGVGPAGDELERAIVDPEQHCGAGAFRLLNRKCTCERTPGEARNRRTRRASAAIPWRPFRLAEGEAALLFAKGAPLTINSKRLSLRCHRSRNYK
jgi:hypothetical protein